MSLFFRKSFLYFLLLLYLLLLASCVFFTNKTDVSDASSQPIPENTNSVIQSNPAEESSELESSTPIEHAPPLTEEERLTGEKEFYRRMNSLQLEDIAKLEIIFISAEGSSHKITSNPKLIRQWVNYFQNLEVTAQAPDLNYDGGGYIYKYYDFKGNCHTILSDCGVLNLPGNHQIEWNVTKSNGKWKELYEAMEDSYSSQAK